MELVNIQIECSREAALTLIPLLMKARELTHAELNKWLCFYANSTGGFRLGNITYCGEDHEKSQSVGEALEKNQSLWNGKAVFLYELDGTEYEHIEQDIVLSDASE